MLALIMMGVGGSAAAATAVACGEARAWQRVASRRVGVGTARMAGRGRCWWRPQGHSSCRAATAGLNSEEKH